MYLRTQADLQQHLTATTAKVKKKKFLECFICVRFECEENDGVCLGYPKVWFSSPPPRTQNIANLAKPKNNQNKQQDVILRWSNTYPISPTRVNCNQSCCIGFSFNSPSPLHHVKSRPKTNNNTAASLSFKHSQQKKQ